MQDEINNEQKPRRRQRYKGRHPRRYQERYKELHPEQYPEMQGHIREQGRTPAGAHVPVLLREVLQALNPQPGETALDCTIGYGGHAGEILKLIGEKGVLVGTDVDAEQLGRTRQRLNQPNVHLFRSNFAGLAKIMGEMGMEGYDIILADLGVSSMQIDNPERGFSYKYDGPLDMRMDNRIKRTAADLLRTMPEQELVSALTELGDEPDAAQIAHEIVLHRQESQILTTLELVKIVLWAKKVDPHQKEAHKQAAKTFQALRILVNDELGALGQLLRMAPHCLKPGGRLAIITFHSGEDRLVKHTFRDAKRAGVYAEISDEAVRPSADEIRSNPRSASAKLRWAKK